MAHTSLNVNIDPLFARALARQRGIQVQVVGQDPAEMPADQRIDYIRTMILAAVVEMTEALDETRWKPWAKPDPTKPPVNREKFRGELADVFLFLMNLMLAGDITAAEFMKAVDEKQTINIQRHKNGYDGNNKCPRCKAAYDDPAVTCKEAPPYMNDQELRIIGWCARDEVYITATGELA